MLLRRAGIPTPATWVAESSADARAVLMRETARGQRLVLKPLFGSQGRGLQRLGMRRQPPCGARSTAASTTCSASSRAAAGAGATGACSSSAAARSRRWCDAARLDQQRRPRGRAAKRRRSRTTFAQLAERRVPRGRPGLCRCRPHARRRDGRPVVVEVNGIPAWQGLQSVSRVDIAAAPGGRFPAAPARPASLGGVHERDRRSSADAGEIAERLPRRLPCSTSRRFKPGNVSLHGPGTACRRGLPGAAPKPRPRRSRRRAGAVGERILRAVEATRRSVAANTNLGIVLLARAARFTRPRCSGCRAARGRTPRLRAVLAGLTVADAELAYRAIRARQPGRPGHEPAHDVADRRRRDAARCDARGAERDRIARQYATGFEDVFETGLGGCARHAGAAGAGGGRRPRSISPSSPAFRTPISCASTAGAGGDRARSSKRVTSRAAAQAEDPAALAGSLLQVSMVS